MIDPDQHIAFVVCRAGHEDLARAIHGSPAFQCDTAVAGQELCRKLAQAHQRQQLLADAIAVALALSVAAIVGQVAIAFVRAIGRSLGYREMSRSRPLTKPHAFGGALSDGQNSFPSA